LWTTGFHRVGQVAQNLHNRVYLHRTPALLAVFDAVDNPRVSQNRQVARDHGKIDSASFRQLAYGARAAPFR
jgi:hypothetical protein